MVQPGSAAVISACACARAAGRPGGPDAVSAMTGAARLVGGRDLDADLHSLLGAGGRALGQRGERRADAGPLDPDRQAALAAGAVAGERHPDDLKRPPGRPGEQSD
jgi:hypothetical protein